MKCWPDPMLMNQYVKKVSYWYLSKVEYHWMIRKCQNDPQNTLQKDIYTQRSDI